jgi:TonB-linked SusC/RagA family outer membrane protein
MRKMLLFISLLLMVTGINAFAQDRQISGIVTSSEDNSPLPGVNIAVKGTNRGTTTGADGSYKISVGGQSILVFSFVGFAQQTINVADRTTVNIALQAEVGALEEVVVTALGQSRDKKALGFSSQSVSEEKLNNARNTNVADALTGKVAGIQVFGQSGAKFGTPTIRIRGINSLTGADPLYVVDGTPTDINYVNMDDVESINVLKGASASALYGNRASQGVIIITTKKGTKQDGIGLDFNHSTVFDQVSLLPTYQNEYGGGYSQGFDKFTFNPAIHPAAWSAFNGQNTIDYSADESWGPKMDGTLYRPWYSWIPSDPDFGKQVPFSPNPNNVRDFFNTGLSVNNNIAFSKKGEGYSFRVSYTNIYGESIVPNSNQQRDYLSVKVQNSLTKKLSMNLNLNYANERTLNRPADGYSGSNQTVGQFNQWFQRQLDLTQLKTFRNPDGTYRSWNITGPENTTPLYWDNPYTEVNANNNNFRNDKIFGDIGISYKITDFLSAGVIARKDLNNYNFNSNIASGTKRVASFGLASVLSIEDNYEGILNFDKTFGEITVKALAGGNIRRNSLSYIAESTSGGLATPELYNIGNSVGRPNVANSDSKSEVRSIYGSASVDYKDLVYLEVTARNDWSSTLPKANNSYFYPSASLSLIFTELTGNSGALSFGKIRGAIAQVGSDIGAYQITPVFAAGNPVGTNPTQSLPTRLPNTNLKPGISTSYEGGIDLKFFKNRLSLELTAYTTDNKNQILPLTVPSSSGYTSALVNAGNIRSSGVELHLNALAVKTKDFSWEVDVNLDRNRSKVIELADNLKAYRLDNIGQTIGNQGLTNSPFAGVPIFGGSTLNLVAREGSDWGVIVGRKIRTFQAKDAAGNNVENPSNGKRMVDAEGFYLYDNGQDIASILPDFKGGMFNTFKYKDFSLKVMFDFVVGGKFYSTTRMFNAGSGLSVQTTGLNDKGKPVRDDPADGGGVLLSDAVKTDGAPNDIYVDAQTLYETKLFDLNEYWTYDKTYVKMREINFGYNLPKSFLSKTPFRMATIALLVRNPFLMYSKVGGGIDPSETQSLWGEGGQLPPTRSYGVNLKFSF